MAKTIPLLLLAALTITLQAEPDSGRGRILDREGRVLAETVDGLRRYPYEAIACHTLGYVGKKRPDDDKDVEGRYGIERTAEKKLGAGDVTLTLDLEFQFIVESVLREVGVGAGSVVVIDPTNGDVLAMASLPSFDPNIWVPSISSKQFQQFLDNPALPLLDRAARGQYPSGSTMKPVAGLAVGAEGDPQRCDGTTEIGGRSFRCWKRSGHGELDLTGAIVKSCNCYFYQTAQRAGLDRLSGTAKQFGLGSKTGIELDVDEDGTIPDAAFLKEQDADLDQQVPMLAIGQGYVQVTPLQMAVVAATFANGGERPAPRLLLERDPVPAVPLEGIDPEAFATVRAALRKVVADPGGTARRAGSDKIAIAGKTGTAQWKPNKGYVGWFNGFAPYDEPRYAIAVCVENAKAGGAVCAPIAKKILERFATIDAGGKIDVNPLAPVDGHTERIDEVK